MEQPYKLYKMKKDIIDFLGNLGITWKYLANGVIGGAAWSFHTKSDIFDSIRQIFIGGMVAGFTTPLIAERVGIKLVGFLSYVVGVVGMVAIDYTYKLVVRKLKHLL
jgi:hypothetical protein